MKNLICNILLMAVLILFANSNLLAIQVKINDTRPGNFYLQALNLVLKKSGEKFKIIVYDKENLSQARMAKTVKSGELDLLYAGTTKQLEKDLIPIRFPVMRGFIGRRLLLINKGHQVIFNKVKSLYDLKSFTGVQGVGWGDTKILKAAGLKIHSDLYKDIFKTLNAGRLIYFPRGIFEIYNELETWQAKIPKLTIEKNIMITYPFAVFFFVSPKNKKLAQILRKGFINSYKDGSYNKFFYNHPMVKSTLKKSNFNKRIIIEIPNPFLTSQTMSIPKKYWHSN